MLTEKPSIQRYLLSAFFVTKYMEIIPHTYQTPKIEIDTPFGIKGFGPYLPFEYKINWDLVYDDDFEYTIVIYVTEEEHQILQSDNKITLL